MSEILPTHDTNEPNAKSIFLKARVPGPPAEVWRAWITEEGVKSFFAPACYIDMWPNGRYEMLFNPDAPEGQRGGEGNVVLAMQPQRMLSFTWNSPPHLSVREQRTHVTIRFAAIDENHTQVTLYHDGWGEGDDWDMANDYFRSAWGKVVLPRLIYRFAVGPVDWSVQLDLEPYQLERSE